MADTEENNPEQNADAARLTALYRQWKADERARGGNATQEAVAHGLGISQSAFSQFCRGIRPLNADLLIRMRQSFGWEPADISPSLAAKMSAMAAATGDETSFDWPFDRIDLRKVKSLSRDDLKRLQDGMVFVAAELNIDIRIAGKNEEIAM